MNVTGLVHTWIGLYERIFITSAVVWLEVMAIRLLLLPDQIGRTKKEIRIFLNRGLSQDFWESLAASSLIVFSKFKTRQKQPLGKSDVIGISKYVAFGASVLLFCNGCYLSRKERKLERGPSIRPLLNVVLFFGARKLGKQLGLNPVTNLALNIVKDEK